MQTGHFVPFKLYKDQKRQFQSPNRGSLFLFCRTNVRCVRALFQLCIYLFIYLLNFGFIYLYIYRIIGLFIYLFVILMYDRVWIF